MPIVTGVMTWPCGARGIIGVSPIGNKHQSSSAISAATSWRSNGSSCVALWRNQYSSGSSAFAITA